MNRDAEMDNLFKKGKEIKKRLLEDMDRLKGGGKISLSLEEYKRMIQSVTGNEIKTDIDEIESFAEKKMSVWEQMERYEECLNHILYRIIEERRYYCCIGRADLIPGLASHAITNLGNIAMALNQGYIPVVDTVRCENFLQQISKITGQNAWEFFFQQPFGKRLTEISENDRVVYTNGIPQLRPDEKIATNTAALDFWRRMLKRFMPVSGDILALADEKAEQLGMRGRRVVGVLCRGTDYIALKPYQHPVQPEVDEVIRKTKDIMKQYDCDLCYLATEDEGVWQAFRKELGDRLVCSQTVYYEGTGNQMLCDINAQWNVNVLEKNREYLAALVLLSECNCFLSGKTSGMVLALILAEDFEYFYAWDYGEYGISDPRLLRHYTL